MVTCSHFPPQCRIHPEWCSDSELRSGAEGGLGIMVWIQCRQRRHCFLCYILTHMNTRTHTHIADWAKHVLEKSGEGEALGAFLTAHMSRQMIRQCQSCLER